MEGRRKERKRKTSLHGEVRNTLGISGPWVIVLPVIKSLLETTAPNSNIKKGQLILNAEKHFPQVMLVKRLFSTAAWPENRAAFARKEGPAQSPTNSPRNLLCRSPARGKHKLKKFIIKQAKSALAGKAQSKQDFKHLFAAPQPFLLAHGDKVLL